VHGKERIKTQNEIAALFSEMRLKRCEQKRKERS
jgi:hypothetical protein